MILNLFENMILGCPSGPSTSTIFLPTWKRALLRPGGSNREGFVMKYESLRQRSPVRWLTITAVFMAMNIALSSFGMPVPGGHLLTVRWLTVLPTSLPRALSI